MNKAEQTLDNHHYYDGEPIHDEQMQQILQAHAIELVEWIAKNGYKGKTNWRFRTTLYQSSK